MDIGKIPPHDLEAEQAVIGSMLTDKDAVMRAIELLDLENRILEVFKQLDSKSINLYKNN